MRMAPPLANLGAEPRPGRANRPPAQRQPLDNPTTGVCQPAGRADTLITPHTCPHGGSSPRLEPKGDSAVMRSYELMVIVSGSLEESAAHSWINTLTKQISAVGGSIHGTPDWWGKRRLAYPIKKQSEGFYAIFNVVAPGGALDEVERTLRIADDVLRHKLLRLPDHEAARRGMAVASA